MWVQSLCGGDPLEKGTATHSRILAWRVPWAEEPGGLQSMGLQEVDTSGVTQHAQALQDRTVATPASVPPHPLPRCPSVCLAQRTPCLRRSPQLAHCLASRTSPGRLACPAGAWRTGEGAVGLVCMDSGVSCILPSLLLLVVGSAQTGRSDHGVDYPAGEWAWDGESVA